MNSMILFGAFCAAAYVLQILLGLKQLKNFNVTYGQLRKMGRVAIGRRSDRGKRRIGRADRRGVDAKRQAGSSVRRAP